MALTPTIKTSQARALAVTDVDAATSIVAPQARGLAVINYPAEAIKSPQARVLPVVRRPAQIHVAQARVLVVGRGRFERPRVRAWTYSLDGHDFYFLRLPDETLVCDLSTKQWHVWGSGDDALWRAVTGIAWQRSFAAANNFGSNVIACDDTLGTLYILNPDGQVDENPDPSRDDIPFRRVVVGQIPLRGRNSIPCWGVEVYGSVGEQASDDYVSVNLYTSDDQGHSFYDHGSRDVAIGEYDARLDWGSLGQMEAPGRLFMLVDYGALVRIDSMEMPDAES